MPKVSVIIPLYNKAPYVERALNSVLAQTEQDFEILVVDDGSTDGGTDVVREFKDDRIRLIRQSNAGVSAARNKGVDAAQAQLVAFLDADDAWKPKFLETVLELHKKYPEAGMCCTACEHRDADKKTRIPEYLGIPKGKWEGIIPNFYFSILGYFPVRLSAVLIPQKIFSDIGLFHVGEKLNEDWDLCLRIAFKYPIAFNAMIGATYYRDLAHSASRFGTVCPDRVVKTTCLKALREGTVKGASAEYVKEFICAIDLEIAVLMLLAGQRGEAKKVMANCHTKRFLNKKILIYLCFFIPRKLLVFLFQLKKTVTF